jgi:hypothetical protein
MPVTGAAWFPQLESAAQPARQETDVDGARIQEFSIEIPDKDADTIHSGT